MAARVLAARPVPKSANVMQTLAPGLSRLDTYEGVPDIATAAWRIAQAIIEGGSIAMETDHDCDGVSSHAVLYRTLVDHFGLLPDRVKTFIGHRLKDG